MRAIFHPEADEDFQQAIDTYQAESVELGLRFYRSVLAAVARIEGHPRAWPRLRGDVRKCLGEDFPYKLLYAIEAGRLHAVAFRFWNGTRFFLNPTRILPACEAVAEYSRKSF